MDNKIGLGLEEISKFIFASKYARYNEKLKRRETWVEAVKRVEEMHLKKYSFLPKEYQDKLKWAFDLVREQRVVPSMRALEDSTPILTSNGWKIAGNIKTGDKLYSSDGKETKVLDVIKFNNKSLYKITFSDNSSLTACDEHLWIVYTSDDRKNNKKPRVVDTLFLLNHLKQGDKNNISIKNPEPVDFNKNIKLKIDPYILGLWLGDGYSSGQAFAAKPGQDSDYMESAYNKAGYPTKKAGDKNKYAWNVLGNFKEDLKQYNLLNNKHIPEDFLFASVNERIFLVQGLMDTDGCCFNGRCLFSNTNKVLLNQFKFLLSSLGIKYTETTRVSTKSDIKDCTTISFFPRFNVFRMSRKKEILDKKLFSQKNDRTLYRKVISVTKEKCGNATCFHVDSKDNSFLAGEKLIVTHNSMQFGGKAVEAHNPRIFNCAVRHVDSFRSFSEIFYLLLCGCGVGIGLSKFFLNRLPDLANEKDKTGTIITYVVEDDIEGWADSVEALLMCYFKNTPYTGRKIVFDYSRIRPEGSPLKTGGGKAPGYSGLKACHKRIKELLDHIIEYKKQSRLKSVDAYDILMHCGDAVLSGGIRRTACSVVFDKDDIDMINAKTYLKVDKIFNFYYLEDKQIGGKTYKYYEGKVNFEGKRYEVHLAEYELPKLKEEMLIFWKHIHPQRARSNNSVLLLRDKVSIEEFQNIIGKTRQFGEPGFVWGNHPWQLFNPCFEIGFIPVTEDGICGVQFCNLTSQNGSKIDTLKKWKECVEAAVIIGTLQAGYTNFNYLSKYAEILTKEESLLGVSMTGIMDNPDLLLNPEHQSEMAKYAIQVNEEWAKQLKINSASRITCVKPEGTGSLVLQSSSGIHPRHSKKFIRRVQVNFLENPYRFFKSFNPHACEKSVWDSNGKDEIISFPIVSPQKSMVKSDLSAIKHLKYIKSTQQNWVLNGISQSNKKPIEHNVSCTVTVKDSEWSDVINYIYDNKKFFAAVSLLPDGSDKSYPQAPNEAVITDEDEKHFNDLLDKFKKVDYSFLKEEEDATQPSKEASCSGGMCEIV